MELLGTIILWALGIYLVLAIISFMGIMAIALFKGVDHMIELTYGHSRGFDAFLWRFWPDRVLAEIGRRSIGQWFRIAPYL